MNRRQKNNQAGNIIFFILLAIFLIGLVTAALRSGGIESASIDREDMTIKVSQVRQNAAEIEHAVNLVMQNGISENDISFANADAPSAYGTLNSNPKAEVFNTGGGGARYRPAPSGVNDGSGWEFYGATALPDVGSEKPDLVAVLPNVTKDFCAQVNRINGQFRDAPPAATAEPIDDGTCVNGGSTLRFGSAVHFPSSSINTMDESSFTAKPAGEACVQCSSGATTYNYYHVLMSR
ncbi:MAG: hypothetical protein JWO78_1803 [Micavibrio sp.]|nr:hypothetical protein [Micavibrio sp.]